MHDFLLTAIIISICAMFVEGFIVFRNLKNKLHAYLFLNCIVMLVNNTGYLLELLSKTEDEYIAALKFSYAGRVWIIFSLFMFTIEFCHINVPKIIIRAFIFFNVSVYALVFTLREHSLYYSKSWFDKDGLFPVLLHRNGIAHQVFMISQAAVIIIVFYWLFKSLKGYKGKIAKQRTMIIIAGFFVEAVLFVCQITHAFFVTYFFDI